VSEPALPLRRVTRVPHHPMWLIALLASSLATAGCGNMTARGLNAQGVRQFEQARYEQAIQQFQQAVYNDPTNADGHYNLAAAYHRLGTLNKSDSYLRQAEQYYHMCLDRNADHRQCYRGLAVLLVEQDRKDEAFRLLEGWATRGTNLAEPKVELARLYQEHGERDEAKRQLIEALRTDPNHARALAALGKLREDTGDMAQALADYKRSLVKDRYQPEVAARVSALQSAFSPSPLVTIPPSGTQTAGRGTTTLR